MLFSTIRIPKNVRFDKYEKEPPTFFKINAKVFEIEEGNKYGNFSYNGVWTRNFTDADGIDQCQLFYFPHNSNRVSYTYPDFVTSMTSCDNGAPWDSRTVLYIDDNMDSNMYIDVADCTFYGFELPSNLRNNGYSTHNSKFDYRQPDKNRDCMKAFGSCNLDLGNSVVAARVPIELENVRLMDLYNIYNVVDDISSLEYLELSAKTLPEIMYDNPDFPEKVYKELAQQPKVITYVRSELLDGFFELQSQKLFPANADLKPIEDKLYLYAQLDNGKWINGQTQMVYAVCRFGESDIKDFHWEVDNDEICKIDNSGVLTVTNRGNIMFTCTITDTSGIEYQATKQFNITDAELTLVNEIVYDDVEFVESPGVYNLQGIKVGETVENLPAGIYIVNGKKMVVK